MSQSKTNRVRLILLLLLIAGLLCAAAALLRETRAVLVIEDRHSGARWLVELEDERFALGFTHSVMKTPVEERYRTDPQLGLVLEETVYQSYGVGLPFLPEEGELLVEDGVFTLRMERVIGQLNMSLSDIPDHTLRANGRRWELTPLLGGGTHQVRLSVQYRRFWRFQPNQTTIF